MNWDRLKEFFSRHVAETVLVIGLLIFSTIPLLDIRFAIGSEWRGILPTFSDELNFARVNQIGNGYISNGNGYFLEHADGKPLVIFGGAWLNAIPLWLGIPFNLAMGINFVIWTLLFGAVAYWLCRELRMSSWLAVGTTLFLYLQSYWHVWRPSNLQPVYPFYFLYYIAFFRFVREQSRFNSIFLALTIGSTFYVFAYLWQIAVITMGLLFFYALGTKQWELAKSTFWTSFFGGLIGLPVPLFMLWTSLSTPAFWESMGRLGLVHTHLPMAEVVYSGGWIGVMFVLFGLVYWAVLGLRADRNFQIACVFFVINGAALWIMISSNLFTGKLLETGEHVRTFIFPLSVLGLATIGTYVWKWKAGMSRLLQFHLFLLMGLLLMVNVQFGYHSVVSFFPTQENTRYWVENQSFAGPFEWLVEHEAEPVVVWSSPKSLITSHVPIFTKHFVLYHFWGMLELVPDSEIRERYLVSQYFEPPTIQSLQSHEQMSLYLGRHDYPHYAKTIERGVKVCRLFFFWKTNEQCGPTPSPKDILGEAYFIGMQQQFENDIKPNIRSYLKKYHVSYILKDMLLDTNYRPEELGGVLVFSDGRYELYDIKNI